MKDFWKMGSSLVKQKKTKKCDVKLTKIDQRFSERQGKGGDHKIDIRYAEMEEDCRQKKSTLTPAPRGREEVFWFSSSLLSLFVGFVWPRYFTKTSVLQSPKHIFIVISLFTETCFFPVSWISRSWVSTTLGRGKGLRPKSKCGATAPGGGNLKWEAGNCLFSQEIKGETVDEDLQNLDPAFLQGMNLHNLVCPPFLFTYSDYFDELEISHNI